MMIVTIVTVAMTTHICCYDVVVMVIVTIVTVAMTTHICCYDNVHADAFFND